MHDLLGFATHPIVLMPAIIVIAWIWEDAARISAALLSADHRPGIPAAVFVFALATWVFIISGVTQTVGVAYEFGF